MFLAIQLAALTLGGIASCPSNLANDLAAPASATSSQAITIEASTARATYATARTWSRVDGCLHRSALVHVLRWLDPGARPQIAIGTAASLRQSRGG